MDDISDPYNGNEEYDDNEEYTGVEQTIEHDELYDVTTSPVAHEYEDGAGLIQQSPERTQYESHKDDVGAITTEYESHKDDDDGARWVHNPTIPTEYESHEDDDDGARWVHNPTIPTEYESHEDHDGARWVHNPTIPTEYENHEDHDGARWVHNPTIPTEYENHEDHDGARWVHNTTITTHDESHEYHGGVDGVEQSEDGGRVDLDTFEGDPSDIGTMDALIEWLEKFDYNDGRVEKVEQSSGQDDEITDDLEPGTGQYQPFDSSDLEDASKALAKFEVEQDSHKPPNVSEDLSEFESVDHEGRDEIVEQFTGKSIPSSWVSGKKRSDGVRVGRSQGQSIPSKGVSTKKPPKDSLVDRDKALLYDFQGKIRALWLNCKCTIEDFNDNFITSKISPDTFDGDDPHEGGLIRVSNCLSKNPSDDPLYNDRSHHQESFRSFQEFHDTIQKLKRLVHIYTTWDNAGVRYPDFEIGDNIMLSELWKEMDKFVDCGYWIDVWMHYALIYWTANQKPVLHYLVSASKRARITDRVEHGFKILKHPLDLKKLLGQLEYHLQHLDERSSTYCFPSSASNNVGLAGTVQSQLNSLFRKAGFKSLLKTTELDKRYGSLHEKISTGSRYQTTTTKCKM